MSYAFGLSVIRPPGPFVDVSLPPAEEPPAAVPPGDSPPERHPPAPAPQGMMDKAKAWWGARTPLEQGAVVAGGLTLLGLAMYALASGPRVAMKANLSSAERKRLRAADPGDKIVVDGKRIPVGRILETKHGRLGHRVPPKKYRKLGARRPQDYAWPAGYKYPLVFRTRSGKVKPKETRKHIRAAASYFARYKHRYPPTVRRQIARNINRAKRRYGIGGRPARA